jgi:hypothetical protein
LEEEMKSIRVFLGIALAALVLLSLPVAYGGQLPPAAEKIQADKTMNGELMKVDTAAKVISLKGPDQKEALFRYSDETQVVSADKTVQGLAGKTGAQLRISFKEERGANWATKIEVLEKQ